MTRRSIKILPRILEYLKWTFELKKDLVSVEIGENFIKIAEVISSKDKTEIKRLVKRSINLKDENSPEEIKKIFESSDIPQRHIRLNIPRHLVTVRFLKLPATDEIEIGKIVKIESLKHVPYADEDVVSGYRIVEKFEDGYSSVMIAVAQAETVRRLIEILRKAGLVIESVSLGSEALFLWYMNVRDTSDDKPAMLVDIDAETIDLNVVAGNKILFTRGVSFGPLRAVTADKILEQVSISIAAYKKESGKIVDKVILTGISSRANELKNLLVFRLKASVEVADQMNNIPKSENSYLETEDTSFAGLLGLSLKHKESCVDLMPEDARDEKRFELVKKNFISTFIILMLTLVVIFGLVAKKLHDKKVYISYIDSELKKIAPQVKKIKGMAKEVNIVTGNISERPLAIDLISEVFKITPSGISLTMMEYESHKSVALRGSAPSLSDVFKYVTILEKSPYLENVKVKYANKRAGASAQGADFEISCPISKVK